MAKPLLFFDIEGDNLLYDVTTIHCIVAYDPEVRKYLIYHTGDPLEVSLPRDTIQYSDIEPLLEDFNKYTLVAHNLMGYDRLVLEKLHNYLHPIDDCIDTFVMSSVQYPDREGHGLEYYGNLFRFEKGNHSDFSVFSNDMLQYCIRDVDLLVRVYRYLKEEQGDWDWTQALKLEHRIADIMARQELHGVLFDVEKAEQLVTKIDEEVREIEATALAEIPKRPVMVGAEVKKPFKKDGSLSSNVLEWINHE